MPKKASRGPGPGTKYGQPSVVKALRVPEDLWPALDKMARDLGTTRNELIVRTMQARVKRHARARS